MAEGLTINLEGVSNIEDGGDLIGNPSLKDFIGDSQWLNITTLDVYCFDQ